MYRAIIIDDEEMARTLLSGMLGEYCPNIEVVSLCKDLPNGVKAIRAYKPDLVFLDVEMPGHSGLELLDFFDEKEINFAIVFVTAYNKYAIQAFKLSAVDYLLKPIEETDLKKAMDLFEMNKNRNKENYSVLRDNLKSKTTKRIALTTLNTVSFVETSAILFFQGDGAYTKVILKDGKSITLSKGLKNFENILADNLDFFRCHKSYIVNLSYIIKYSKSDGGYLIIDNQHKIGISQDKVDLLFEKINV